VVIDFAFSCAEVGQVVTLGHPGQVASYLMTEDGWELIEVGTEDRWEGGQP